MMPAVKSPCWRWTEKQGCRTTDKLWHKPARQVALVEVGEEKEEEEEEWASLGDSECVAAHVSSRAWSWPLWVMPCLKACPSLEDGRQNLHAFHQRLFYSLPQLTLLRHIGHRCHKGNGDDNVGFGLGLW